MNKLSWPIKVFFITFILAAIFSGASNLLADLNIVTLIIALVIVIVIGIIFDMIGVAALTSKKENFHAMASKKIKGAKEAINLINKSTNVATICNDVVGDICGIVSGGLGAILALSISSSSQLSIVISTILVTALISGFTVGGKALGKNIATKKADKIVLYTAKIKKVLSFK